MDWIIIKITCDYFNVSRNICTITQIKSFTMFDCSLLIGDSVIVDLYFILYCANETIPYLCEGTAKASILKFFHWKVKKPQCSQKCINYNIALGHYCTSLQIYNLRITNMFLNGSFSIAHDQKYMYKTTIFAKSHKHWYTATEKKS